MGHINQGKPSISHFKQHSFQQCTQKGIDTYVRRRWGWPRQRRHRRRRSRPCTRTGRRRGRRGPARFATSKLHLTRSPSSVTAFLQNGGQRGRFTWVSAEGHGLGLVSECHRTTIGEISPPGWRRNVTFAVSLSALHYDLGMKLALISWLRAAPCKTNVSRLISHHLEILEIIVSKEIFACVDQSNFLSEVAGSFLVLPWILH